jgi:hypothetical protein
MKGREEMKGGEEVKGWAEMVKWNVFRGCDVVASGRFPLTLTAIDNDRGARTNRGRQGK